MEEEVPCVARVIGTRLVDDALFICRSVTFIYQFARFGRASAYVFGSFFRFILVLITSLGGSAQVFNRRGLRSVYLFRFVGTSFRATFCINGTRFRRDHSRAAD